MDTFQELLDRLELLGGTAKNIELRNGKNGRGIFAKDPKKSIELTVPVRLLAPIEWVGLDQNESIFLNEKCTWNDLEKDFFYSYHRLYGWSSVKNNINSHLNELGRLSQKVKEILIKLSCKNNIYSENNNIENCFQYFLSSRRVKIKEYFYLMPLFELLNHDFDTSINWIQNDFVSIKGLFKEEVTVNYSDNYDALDFFSVYGFAEYPKRILSGFLSVKLSSNITIHIGRFSNNFEIKNGQVLPMIIEDNFGIKITFLELYNAINPHLPKETFVKLMAGKGFDSNSSEQLFEGIKSENRKLYIQLLIELQENQGNLVKLIRNMAHYQLMGLA